MWSALLTKLKPLYVKVFNESSKEKILDYFYQLRHSNLNNDANNKVYHKQRQLELLDFFVNWIVQETKNSSASSSSTAVNEATFGLTTNLFLALAGLIDEASLPIVLEYHKTLSNLCLGGLSKWVEIIKLTQ